MILARSTSRSLGRKIRMSSISTRKTRILRAKKIREESQKLHHLPLLLHQDQKLRHHSLHPNPRHLLPT
jgi:hypothetical protein